MDKRVQVCSYCPQIYTFASNVLDLLYADNKIPLYICEGCYDKGKYSDAKHNEYIVRGIDGNHKHG